MSDQFEKDLKDSPSLPPPTGDPKQAEKYISTLIGLINSDKLQVIHTDLSKFDPSSLADHYRVDLKDYSVEISHSKDFEMGKDSYVIIFNNLKRDLTSCEKVILAYMHLDPNQFIRFKSASDEQLEKKRQIEEEKRLNEALAPLEKVFEEVQNTNSIHSDSPQTRVYSSETTSDNIIQPSHTDHDQIKPYSSFLD